MGKEEIQKEIEAAVLGLLAIKSIIADLPSSRERSLAVTNIDQTILWLKEANDKL